MSSLLVSYGFIGKHVLVQVDDKYQYSLPNKDLLLHGWMSFNPSVGFWLINPSDEFRSGGPLKQNLTSHVGPTSLAVSRCYKTV